MTKLIRWQHPDRGLLLPATFLPALEASVLARPVGDWVLDQAMRSSRRDRVIVTGLIDIARQLDLKVVAEGIEEPGDADFLGAHGCDKGQGYLFGRPVPAGLFEERLFASQAELMRA